MHIHPTHLTNTIKQTTGKSPCFYFEEKIMVLAKKLGNRGIAANLVAPGIVETDFTKRAFDSHPQMHDFISSITALGRPGQSDDIGGVIAFLCTEDARWINAQRIEASGGMLL
ncbi:MULTISPECIES: SDR family oxidoreductase [unclassified Mucilaginibacter]|uniref:SDR family oxidoreductase n=1 Tax=unclassified Mucilaginibacter TaxID=2617802 RepID=UPI002AC9F035|nr:MULTISPECIES: SDR family oxidoreductase [unclassified Mucilaginibacter]WPX25128.1 SDR family oxidoreductase [Mucilaginibacter sp. 5C4]